MLMVPQVEQTAMSAQPYQAPGVAPVRNDAPQQLEQSGHAMEQAGGVAFKTGQTIGDAVASQVDDATVKAAEASALGQTQNILYDPTSGYLNQKGKSAIDQYEPATQAVHKAFQDGQGGLGNSIQQLMYKQVMQQHLLSIGQQMSQHSYRETAEYSGDAAVSRANIYATNASNATSSYGRTDADGNATGNFAKNLATAEQETLNAVQITKGAPADSDVAKEALLNLHTQVGTGALSQMMDARAPYSKVQQVYDDMKAKGFLTLRAQDTLGKMVKGYTEQESTRAVVTQNLGDAYRASQGQATNSTGTPDYDFAMKGSTIVAQPYDAENGTVTVNAPSGSNIQAPADGTVAGILADGKGGLGVQVQHGGGSVTSFYGLNATNVKAGDRVQRGEEIGVGAGPVEWSLADKDGNKVDPTRAGLGPVDLTKITDEKVLDAALTNMRKQVTDPYLQQMATSEMEAIVRHNQAMVNAQETQTYKQASDAFYGAGMQWRSIPPSVFNQLNGEQQQHFKDAQTEEVLKNYSEGQRFKEMGETDVVSYFTQNPDMLTPANLDAARPKLANSTYLSLMGTAQRYQNNPQGVTEAQGVNERIKFNAEQAGINVSPKTPADKLTYDSLVHKVTTDIDQIKINNHGKATADQVEKVIQQELIRRTISTPRSAWNPLAWVGSANSETQKYGFQMPQGATHVARGSDGQMHYTDGTKDLGIVK